MRRARLEKGPSWVRQLLDWMGWIREGATWPQRGLHSRTVVGSSSELESSEPVGDPDPESSLWVTHWNECGFTHDHGPGSVLNILHIFLHLGFTTIP